MCCNRKQRSSTASQAAQLRSHVNSHWLSQREPFILDPPPQNRGSLTDRQKIVKGDYVHDFYSYAKFGGNPSMGGSRQIGEI